MNRKGDDTFEGFKAKGWQSKNEEDIDISIEQWGKKDFYWRVSFGNNHSSNSISGNVKSYKQAVKVAKITAKYATNLLKEIKDVD